ncbi:MULTISPECIES: dihydrofolate reductase family protein [Streptomyces]|uniref:Dihydrofolate reductase family protein n=1 Tax=Streptomyces sudanensis TaxID=436397 RepID=A0ABY4T6U0_9ACTN|nr:MULTISPECIES: dihydrofolate reductase family protein [Streptomyces]MCP9956269.1 dihydrofolate reductase family protein [Streptomyces sudanensis]MCP9985482.1 dihydrofolate reductase family protein [Streptomyces sudanensis]MCQ0003103.1 dihydrofolate reductase family protein [Streptomyces sudanensis]URN14697.1 dihydrofolate reductase family protein [Streptomyces sudanensis]
MRIVISEFVSLDGVVQAPGGPEEDTDGGFAHGGWTHPFFDPEVVGGAFDEALEKADALLMGRRTWRAMAGAWPDRAGDPFADRMNSLRKYVVTETLGDDDLTWENTSRIPGGEAVARIRELRAAPGGDLLVMGSPTLVRTLLDEDLVDELRLVVMPVILGGGKSIFPRNGRMRTLEPVSETTGPTGARVCVYRPVAGA